MGHGTHDVVINVRQQAWDSNLGVGLGMRMFRSELKRTDHEINPCTCAIARLSGILEVCPQIVWVCISRVDPASCSGLFLLLDLLWEVLESTSDLVSGLVVLIWLDIFNSKEAWWSLCAKYCSWC